MTTTSTDGRSEALRDTAMLKYISEEAWPIRESVMDRLLEIVGRHSQGVKLSAEQIAAAIGAKADDRTDEPAYREEGATAFVTVSGVLAKHAGMVNGISQPEGSSTERIGADLARARSNPRIKTVVLRMETPGGSIGGISDLGDQIYAMNGEKRMVAFADDQACSAGVWLASQCREFYTNKAAAVGSIGVICVLADYSARAKDSGVKYHVIKSGPYKGNAGAPVEPAAEDLQELQARVNTLHAVFVGEVARGRSLDVAAAAAFSDGRVFTGAQAVDLGLCDGVCSFEELLAMISQGLDRPEPVTNSPKGGRYQAATGEQPMTAQSDAAAKAAQEAAARSAAESATADALATAQQAGATAERARIQAIGAALPGEAFAAARGEAIEKGLDVQAAKALAFDAAAGLLAKAAKDLQETCQATTAAKAETERFHKLALAAGIKDALPAGQDPESGGGENAGGAGGAYEARVAALVKGGTAEHRARMAAGGEFPEAHAAWRSEQDKKRRRK